MKTTIAFVFLLVISLLSSCLSTNNRFSTDEQMLTATYTAMPKSPSPTLESSSTSLSVSVENVYKTGHVIHVHNLGKATAKNPKLWICVEQSNNEWQNIQGIKSFQLQSNIPSIMFTQDYYHRDTCIPVNNNEKDAPNILALTLEPLGIGEEFPIRLGLLPEIETQERNSTLDVYVKIPQELKFGETDGEIVYNLSDLLIEYFNQVSAMSNLYIKAECTNCSNNNEAQLSYKFTPYLGYGLLNFKKQSSNGAFLNVRFDFEIKYLIFDNQVSPPDKKVLYLLTVENAQSGKNALVEISKEQFENTAP
jgi:hypothetical protein